MLWIGNGANLWLAAWLWPISCLCLRSWLDRLVGVSKAFRGDRVPDGANAVTGRLEDGCQALRALPLEEEPDGGSVAPAVPEGGDHLWVAALHPGGHLVG